MAIYEYECIKCGQRTEELVRISTTQVGECSHCKGELRRLYGGSVLLLWGKGWGKASFGLKRHFSHTQGDAKY